MTTLDVTPDLDPVLVNFLLMGPEGLRALPTVPPERLRLVGQLLKDRERLANLWLTHEPELRRLAAAQGWRPGFPGQKYFAEVFAGEARR